MSIIALFLSFFFFNDTAPTEIYTLSLHDALPIYAAIALAILVTMGRPVLFRQRRVGLDGRSEEHTSELQSRGHLVCRLLLEKKKKKKKKILKHKKKKKKNKTNKKKNKK